MPSHIVAAGDMATIIFNKLQNMPNYLLHICLQKKFMSRSFTCRNETKYNFLTIKLFFRRFSV